MRVLQLGEEQLSPGCLHVASRACNGGHQLLLPFVSQTQMEHTLVAFTDSYPGMAHELFHLFPLVLDLHSGLQPLKQNSVVTLVRL